MFKGSKAWPQRLQPPRIPLCTRVELKDTLEVEDGACLIDKGGYGGGVFDIEFVFIHLVKDWSGGRIKRFCDQPCPEVFCPASRPILLLEYRIVHKGRNVVSPYIALYQ